MQNQTEVFGFDVSTFSAETVTLRVENVVDFVKIFLIKDYCMNQRIKYNLVTIICPILMVVFSELSFEVSDKFMPMIYVILVICIFIRHMIKCPNCNYKTGKGLFKFGNYSVIWWKVFAPKKCIRCGYDYNANSKIECSKSENFKISKYARYNTVLGIFISSFSFVGILISFIGSKFSDNIMRINIIWIKYMPFLLFIGLMFFIMGYVLKNTKKTSLRIFISIALIFNSMTLIFWFILYALDTRNTFNEFINGISMLKIPIKSEYVFIVVVIIMAVFIVIPFIYNILNIFNQIRESENR
ncbi:MAG TPA: hypothetical protein PLH15_09660 [Spirochaetota bacterium]|nr:hypothetical protein [Spirochaetota bacterium]